MKIISEKKSRQRPIIGVYQEFVCCKGDNIRQAGVLLEIMITISSNTAVFERGFFFFINREKSVLQIRLGEDNLDHIMCINIYSPSFDNFDTDKSVSDQVKSPVYLRHLNIHHSSRTETHEEPDENFFFYKS